MQTRNGTPIEICWLLLDAGHVDYAVALDTLRTAHQARGPALSVNTRHDGTQSLVKLLGPVPILPAGVTLRTYTPADHNLAQDLVATFATDLDPSAGWQAPVAP